MKCWLIKQLFSFTFLLSGILIAGIAFAAPPYGQLSSESTINPTVMQIEETKYLGNRLQKDFKFIDLEGQEFTLGEMFGKAFIIVFSYYECDGTCPTLNISLIKALKTVDRFEIGKDYHVLTVSFDEHDTVERMNQFVESLEMPEYMKKGWRYAILKNSKTGIDQLTGSMGYNYFWSRADQVFLHPNVLIFVTPEGRVARYIYGTTIDKDTLELALIDADWNRISNSSNVIDILTGVCYSYNYQEGKYTLNYAIFVGVVSLFGGILLVIFSFVIFKHNIKKD